jgi:DNA-binding MarR family transcriptional regulator
VFCYCAEARRVSRLLIAKYDAALAPAEITSAQFETLSVLHAMERCSGRVLAQKLGVDKTTLSRNLCGMIKAGLVVAKGAPEDARQAAYSLSAAGRRKLAKAQPLWKKIHEEIEQQLGSDAASTQRVLQRITAAL